jgi:GTP-dependent phosphoenolpyruvate carboxykinase
LLSLIFQFVAATLTYVSVLIQQLHVNGEADSTTVDGTDSQFEESDDSTDDEEWLLDDEERHPPEHYLTASANLDVARLRQKTI